MTTPAPEKTAARRKSRRRRSSEENQQTLRLTWAGWLLSWLLPTAAMGAILLALSFFPGLDSSGYLSPLIPAIGGAAVVLGIPGTLLVGWLYRHQTQPMLHILGYAVVGLLYGPAMLVLGTGGLVPMLIPIVGFPAAILLGIGRWIAQPLSTVTTPGTQEPSLS